MKETLARRAYDELRLKLARGELPPGTRLINRTLADEMGISFTPVREAINQLSSEGLVEYVRGGGAYVRRLDRQELAQLYDVRLNIEPLVAREAALHITQNEIEELEEVCADWDSLVAQLMNSEPDREIALRWAANEERFHHVLFDATRNRWLGKIGRDMLLVSQAFAPLCERPSLLQWEPAAETARGHAILIPLLQSRDGDAASEWAVNHIERGRQYVLDFLKTRREGSEQK